MSAFLGLRSGTDERVDQEEASLICTLSEAYNTVGVAAHDHDPGAPRRTAGEESIHLVGYLRGTVRGVAVGLGEFEVLGACPDIRGMDVKDKANVGECGINDGVC